MALRHAFHSSIMAPFIGSKFQNHVFLAELRKNIGYTKKMPLHWLHGKEGWNTGKNPPFQYGPSIEQCLLRVSCLHGSTIDLSGEIYRYPSSAVEGCSSQEKEFPCPCVGHFHPPCVGGIFLTWLIPLLR